MRYLITLSYDGTNYNGYQTQPGKNTIQEKIEDALTKKNMAKEKKKKEQEKRNKQEKMKRRKEI